MVHETHCMAEAQSVAAKWREDLEGTDWKVVIHEPLFDGDFWLVATE